MSLKNFRVCPYGEYRDHRSDLIAVNGTRWLIKGWPYTTIYGTPGRREYFIETPEWQGQLECKFQNVGGSVDEKMVYVTETLKRLDIARLAIVFGGQYWKTTDRGQGIIRWLRKEALALQTHGKQLLVCSQGEFLDWANKTWS